MWFPPGNMRMYLYYYFYDSYLVSYTNFSYYLVASLVVALTPSSIVTSASVTNILWHSSPIYLSNPPPPSAPPYFPIILPIVVAGPST